MNDYHSEPSIEPADESGLATGNWHPSWESSARLDPAWTEKAIAVSITPAVSGALDPKTVELVRIALEATRPDPDGIRRHIRRALQSGATQDEIVAVLQLACLQGLNNMRFGAPILLEELERLESRDR